MASKATIRSSLQMVIDGQVVYQGQPTQFDDTVVDGSGPYVGTLRVQTNGTIVDLSEITKQGLTPGHYRIYNQDEDNYVEVGIYDAIHRYSFMLNEIGPLQSYVNKFSRNFGEDHIGTGSGTDAYGSSKLILFANKAPCKVLIEVFAA